MTFLCFIRRATKPHKRARIRHQFSFVRKCCICKMDMQNSLSLYTYISDGIHSAPSNLEYIPFCTLNTLCIRFPKYMTLCLPCYIRPVTCVPFRICIPCQSAYTNFSLYTTTITRSRSSSLLLHARALKLNKIFTFSSTLFSNYFFKLFFCC